MTLKGCILWIVLAAGCAFPAAALGLTDPVSVIDAMDRKVTVRQPAERIAFSAACLGEALLILDVWDRVAARGHMNPDPHLYPNIDKIPAIGVDNPSPYNINYEKLLELDVDALITIKVPSKGFEEMRDKIKSRFPIVVMDMFLPKTYQRNFSVLGRVLGADEKAKDFITWSGEIIRRISARTAKLTPEQKPRYFIKWSFGNVQDFTTISDQYPGMADLNRILGAINVAGKIPRMWGGPVDPEWLIQQPIDVIVCQDALPGGYGIVVEDPAVPAEYRKKVMKLSVFAASNAVRHDRVYMITPQYMFAPGFVVYLAYLAKWLHPDLFQDLDPGVIQQEYLTRFMGISHEMSQKAVFAYPK